MNQSTQQENQLKIEIDAYGSFVYKADLRAILGVQYKDYAKEITLLFSEIKGFEEVYKNGSDHRKVRLHIAIIIVTTIISRETGRSVEVIPSYAKCS